MEISKKEIVKILETWKERWNDYLKLKLLYLEVNKRYIKKGKLRSFFILKGRLYSDHI